MAHGINTVACGRRFHVSSFKFHWCPGKILGMGYNL